jgi:Protein of unknown function (DUF2783)
MQKLKTNANMPKPDDLYELLIRSHDGLTKAQSDAFNARLIMILMNHIGDEATLREALSLAQSTARS